MRKTFKKLTALFLVFTVVASMSIPSYAGFFDAIGDGLGAAVDWGKGAAEDIGDAAETAADWTVGAAEDIGDAAGTAANWTVGAAEDVGDAVGTAAKWTAGAAEDVGDAAVTAGNWTIGAAEDTADALGTAANWTVGAAEDVGDALGTAANWTAGAAEDAYNWSEGAVEDVGDALVVVGETVVDVGEAVADAAIDVFTDEVELSELQRLPVLEVDESQMTDMLDSQYGNFTYLDNVREKKLSSNSYEKIKNELKKIGIPGHIIDFVLEEVAGVEGDNVGEAIADLLPGSIIYGDAVAGVINDIVNNDEFEKVDLYSETIKANDNMEGFGLNYDIPLTGEVGKNILVIATGLKYGKRDDFNVKIKAIDGNGNEEEFPVEKMALNKREVGFVSEVGIKSNNIEKIRVEYVNKFDKPKEPSRLIADGIKDGINGAVPVFNPISNGARNDIVKVLNKLDLNELGGNGDVGVIIADNIVGSIPLVGTALKAIGGIDFLGDLIRKVIGQVEVKSYASIKGGRILVKNYVSASQMNNFVDGATRESANSSIRKVAYDFESNSPDFKYFGDGWLPGSTLYCITNGHANTVLDENDYGNFVAETTVRLNETRGNAGIEFRINNVNGTKNNFQGYLAGIGFNDKKQGSIFFGKQNYNWQGIKSVKLPLVVGKDYTLKVMAVGENIKIYLDGKLYLDVNDKSYRDGYIGYQAWNTSVNFDNFIISESVPFESAEYNFSSSKPAMIFSGETWKYTSDNSSSKLGCYTKGNTKASAVLADVIYDNFVADTQIKKLKNSGKAGIGFRLQAGNTANGYAAGLSTDSAGKIRAYLGKTSPNWTEIKSVNVSINPSEEAKLTVVAHENIIQVFLNGKLVISEVDNTYSSGYVGYSVANTEVLFDNFEIKKSNLKIEKAVKKEGASSKTSTGALELKYRYDFDKYTPMTIYDGSFTGNRAYTHSMYGKNTNSNDGLAIFDGESFSDGIIETNVTVYNSGPQNHDNAGFVFRVSNPKAGNNNFKGYYVGIKPGFGKYQGGVAFGKMTNGNWKELGFFKANLVAMPQSKLVNYKLSVVAKGNQFDVYLDDRKVLSVKDSTYTEGAVGLRTYKLPVIYQYIDVKAPGNSQASASKQPAKKDVVESSGGIYILNTEKKNITDVNFAISFTHKGQKYYTNRNLGDMNKSKKVILKLNNNGTENSSGFMMGNYLEIQNSNGPVPGFDILNAVGTVSDVGTAMHFKMNGKNYVVYDQYENLDTSNMFKLIVEGGEYFSQNDITRGDYLVPTY